MPIQKTRNENFFKVWTPDMAYVLGFFAADGSMNRNKRGGHYIEFQITDGDLLEKIRTLLQSNNKIAIRNRGVNCKPIYRFMYRNAGNMYLQRKKKVFDSFIKNL